MKHYQNLTKRDESKLSYVLVLEFADSGTLRNYLKANQNFKVVEKLLLKELHHNILLYLPECPRKRPRIDKVTCELRARCFIEEFLVDKVIKMIDKFAKKGSEPQLDQYQHEAVEILSFNAKIISIVTHLQRYCIIKINTANKY
ncbi:hypothetical protein F8M41_023844 [Gigaspora margarita]|uniref:Protein kinase domain-containing protein n=1 Tax=Gigaspora margarita TaxID=4874 RepID=A0A8H4ET87_GIGMA|nr:hypothetical protein F8M41_023844 [Gigaspora margarita]